MINKLYNTISCPCDTYAVTLDSGNIGCERDNFGKIQSITPISINNHLISGNIPKVGDKWRCTNIVCKQGSFKWDTLHVIKVEEKIGEATSSIFNSITSISSCHIPKSILKDYSNSEYLNKTPASMSAEELESIVQGFSKEERGSTPISGFDINNIEGYVNGKPIFKTTEQVWWYNLIKGNIGDGSIKYNENGLSGYIPGNIIGTEKLITSVYINEVNALRVSIDDFEIINKDKSRKGNTTISAIGGYIKIRMRGMNNPIFTLSIEDDSGCSLLEEQLKNIVCNGEYTLTQAVPALPVGKTSETYNIKITPAADTRYYTYDSSPKPGTIHMKIYQYKVPVFTLTEAASTITSTSTTSNSITFSNPTTDTLVTTLTNTLSPLDRYYFKQPPIFRDLVSKSNVIKKVIQRNDRYDVSRVSEIVVLPSISSAGGDVDNILYQGDVEIGMRFEGTVNKTKIVTSSIDLDTDKEPCDDCDEVNIFTNKFEINTVDGIFVGMHVTGKDWKDKEFLTELISINSNCIELSSTYAINKNTDLTFNHSETSWVSNVKTTKSGQLITVEPSITLPKGTEITFEKSNKSELDGIVRADLSKPGTAVLTTSIEDFEFGNEDVTFTLNVDDIITNIPNACDQNIIMGKNTTININFHACDSDYDSINKVVDIVAGPSFKHGKLTQVAGAVYTYEVDRGYVGSDKIVFKVADGAQTSAEKTIFITIR
jgi:hypothetical protein